MKIKMSKSQWELVGKKANWKVAQDFFDRDPSDRKYGDQSIKSLLNELRNFSKNAQDAIIKLDPIHKPDEKTLAQISHDLKNALVTVARIKIGHYGWL